jgi:hypothetical protein
VANANPAGPPGGLEVKVINDDTEPVPVTGEVTATISGDVKVVNGAVERVAFSSSGSIEADKWQSDVIYMFEVPDDKVLVVEYVSVLAHVPDNPQAGVSLFVRASGHVIGVLEKTGSFGIGGGWTDYIAKVVRFHVNSGDNLRFLINRSIKDPDDDVGFDVRITGFLEDAPLD